MNVLLLGCGAVGSVIASHLDRESLATEMGLADLDGRRAEGVAARLSGGKAHTFQLDAGDLEAVKRAMKEADLVINATLPSLNPRIMAGALEMGADYIDLAFEANGPFEQHKAWEEAGRVALVGCGEDPGISNVLAVEATRGMEVVDSIRIIDAESAASLKYRFACLFSPRTFLEEALGFASYFREGKLHNLPPFSGKEVYTFPPPVGEVPVYNMDHEEVRTLPRFLGRPVKKVEFKLALEPEALNVLRTVQALDLMSYNPLRIGAVEVTPRSVLLKLIPSPEELRGQVKGYAALSVEALGEGHGLKVWRRLYTYLDHEEAYRRYGATGTAYLTGTGAAAVAHMVMSGEVKETGIFPTECLDTSAFIANLSALGVRIWREDRLETKVPYGSDSPSDGA